MIRYRFDRSSVEKSIKAADRNWFAKAEERTAKFLKLRRYQESSAIWSTVKPTFMALQENKCVFCERQFENAQYGKIEFDLEHFRPKSSVKAWPDPKRHPGLDYTFETGDASSHGYYWLAYDVQNYAAACKVCNTPLKSNYFPVAGDRGDVGQTSADLSQEKPFLCYPIGSIDSNPEDLVTFIATTAVPVAKRGHKHRRGRVIIDFFALNQREQLHRERAQMISLFGPSLENRANGLNTDIDDELISRMYQANLPHAACVRAFERLWHQDEATARLVFDHCRLFATSAPGTAPPDI